MIRKWPMSLITLRSFDRRGLLIQPHESVEHYMARARLCHGSNEPRDDAALKRVSELFEIEPDWVRVDYSDDGLYPWEAACTWYDDVPTVQLRRAFKTKETLFGLYSKQEVLAHEYVHAARAPFADSCFEEFFAYLVSNPFRAYLGPLFQTPKEGLLFMGLLGGLLIASVFGSVLGMDRAFGNYLVIALFALLSCAMIFLVGRLYMLSRQFHRAKKNLLPLAARSVIALMIRLTDEEIRLFSRLAPKQIEDYISERIDSDWRWQILSAYCKNCPIRAQ